MLRKSTLIAVFGIIFLSSNSSAAKPQNVSKRTLEAYESTARKIFGKLDPSWAEMSVGVYPGYAPNADIGERGGALISSEFFNAVQKEDERAAVLAHEMCHRMLNHTSAELFSEFGAKGYDYEHLERNETEADWCSDVLLKRAGFDVCAGARALQIYIDGYNMQRNPDTPMHKIHFRRLGLLKAYCYNKNNLLAVRPASLTMEKLKELNFDAR